jgi:hypothetical protein
MTHIPIQNKLSATHLGKHSALSRLITGKSKLPGSAESHPMVELGELWPTAWWGLNHSQVFQQLDACQQQEVLAACNRTLLNEAYFIEKSGLAYTDTAQLYALIGADEARHLAWLEPYIAEEDKTQPCSSFLAFLSELIEEAPPRLLVYLVQIILEGWGLDHYRRLATGCQSPRLTQVLAQILKDEALHHHSGKVLFSPSCLEPDDWNQIRKALIRYTDLVRVGPLSAVESMESVTGSLPAPDVEEVIRALRHPAESLRKLSLLKELMRQPGLESLVDELESAGHFAPLPLEEAAAVYLVQRPSMPATLGL